MKLQLPFIHPSAHIRLHPFTHIKAAIVERKILFQKNGNKMEHFHKKLIINQLENEHHVQKQLKATFFVPGTRFWEQNTAFPHKIRVRKHITYYPFTILIY